MLSFFNGIYKDSHIIVDVVQIYPFEYDLNGDYIWFDVGISVINSDIQLSAFNFYLADSNKKIINSASILDSSHYTAIKNNYGLFVGFEFKTDFFYQVPVFGFYCDKYKRLELIKLSN